MGEVNFDPNGDIAGSRMTMTCVARNFFNMGYSLVDVFNFTAYNPSRAINVDDRVGELAVGKLANIVITDEKLSSVKYFEI